ncbi:MAG: flagellar protein FlaG [Pseudomonadales bacterium]|nr:flagellar protein FlaG [Pseudomonadales bacterium]
MSEISITRFVPAPPAREKISSVDTLHNDPEKESSSLPQHERSPHKQLDDSRQEHQPEDQNIDSSDAYQPQQGEEDAPLQAAVAKLNEFVQNVQRDIVFGIDDGTDEPLVRVLDRASRKTIRQFGGKEAMELAKKLDTQEPFSLLKTQV